MKKQIWAVSLLGAFALPAAAEGIYITGDLGQARLSGENIEEYNPSISVGAGYKINNGFAVEAAYRNFGELNLISAGNGTTIEKTYDFSAFQLSLVGTIPFTDHFSAYARLGYAQLRYDVDITESAIAASVSDSDSAYKAVYGLGARYAFSDRIDLRLEYNEICDWDGFNVAATTIGADYKF